MNSEARVMSMSPATRTEEKRRGGRRPSEAKDKGPLILVILPTGRPTSEQVVLQGKVWLGRRRDG